MSRTYTYKEAILLVVNTRMGINEINLALEVMACVGPGSFEESEYNTMLTELTSKGEIKLIMYCVPYSHHAAEQKERMMSWFLPKGTHSIKLFE